MHRIERQLRNEELRRAQDALEEARDRYSILYEFAPVAYLSLMPDATIANINLTGAALLAGERGALFGRRFSDFVIAGDRARWRHLLRSVLNKSGRQSGQFMIERADGAVRHGWLDCQRIDPRDQQPVVHVTLADVTARVDTEKALRESEERFRKVFEQGSLSMAMLSISEGRFLRANAAICRMLGYTEEELSRLRFADVTHPEYLQADIEAVGRLWAGQIPLYTTEKRYIRKNGDTFWAALTASLVRSNDGNPLYSLATIEDITERRRTQNIRAQLAAIVETSGDAIISIGMDTRVLSWNAAAERMFGYTTQEIIGRSVDRIVPKDRYAEVTRNRAVLADGQAQPPFDTVRRTKDGRLIDVSITRSLMRDAGGKPTGVSLVIRDISARRRDEERMRMFPQEILSAREEERRVSSVLHHDAGSLAVGVASYMDAIQSVLKLGRREEALALLDRVRELFGGAVARLNSIAVELRPPELEAQERKVLQLIAEGRSNKEVAAVLELSVNTVHAHRNRVMRKLDLHKQSDLVRYAIKAGIAKL